MDKAPFDPVQFTDTVIKESKNIKLSLADAPILDENLLDPIPCPQTKYTASSEASDASIEQLSMWSQQLRQLEDSLGIPKVPAKPRSKNVSRMNNSFLQRSISVPQLNQTKTKHQELFKIPEVPKKVVDIELTKQALRDYCNKRSCDTFKIPKDMINSVCSDLDALTHLFADVKLEYEKQPVVEANDNEELSTWLTEINEAITNINILEASKDMYAVDRVKIQENYLRECLECLSTQLEIEMSKK